MKHKVGELFLHTPKCFKGLTVNSCYVAYLQENIDNRCIKIPESYFFENDECGTDFYSVSNEFNNLILPHLMNYNYTIKDKTYQDIEGEKHYKYLTDRNIKNAVLSDSDSINLEEQFILDMDMINFEEIIRLPYFESYILSNQDFQFEYVKDYTEQEYKKEVFCILKKLEEFCLNCDLASFVGEKSVLINHLASSICNCSGMGSQEKKEKYKIGEDYYILHFKLFRDDSNARIYFKFDEINKSIIIGKIGYHL